MFHRFKLTAALAGFALITGCASVPTASPEKDSAAKSFAVKPGKANIYVYRNETFGGAVKMPIALNGKLAGSTAAKTFMLFEVDPGKQTLLSKTENDSAVDVNAEAGKNYYVWQEVKMGVWSARSQLQLVDEARGKAGVQECKLIETAQ